MQNMDEPWGNDAKPVTKTNNTWFCLYEIPKIFTLRSRWLPETGKGEMGNCNQPGMKFSYARWKSSRDLLYNIVSLVNSAVLYS